jgi:hypothetical protein
MTDGILVRGVVVPPQHVHVKPIYRSGTHIVCTLGPSSRSVEHITSLLERGDTCKPKPDPNLCTGTVTPQPQCHRSGSSEHAAHREPYGTTP